MNHGDDELGKALQDKEHLADVRVHGLRNGRCVQGPYIQDGKTPETTAKEGMNTRTGRGAEDLGIISRQLEICNGSQQKTMRVMRLSPASLFAKFGCAGSQR